MCMLTWDYRAHMERIIQVFDGTASFLVTNCFDRAAYEWILVICCYSKRQMDVLTMNSEMNMLNICRYLQQSLE